MSEPRTAPDSTTRSTESPPPRKKVATNPKLSSVMATNLALLAIVGVTSAVILMFGDFEGKVIRTVTTLILFGVFTGFAAMDSTREAPPRYMLISQIGHMYMLGLSLILIWGSLLGGRNKIDDFSILAKTILIILLVKAGILLVQKISDAVYSPLSQVSLAGKFCAAFLSLTAVLFTQPIGTDYFIEYGDIYWKIAVIVMIFAALTIAMVLLISLYFRDSLAATRNNEEKFSSSSRNADESIRKAPHYGGGQTFRKDQPFKIESIESKPDASVTDFFEHRDEARTPQQPVAEATPEIPPVPSSPPSYAAQPQANPQPPTQRVAPPVAGATNYAPPVAGSQPWPVFPNGLPLPAARNGRPDYAVLQYVASVHAEAERQWFGS